MVSLLPGSSLDRYQLVEQIGRGGMASVFRALDPRLKRFVAVKVLPSFQAEDPTFVERFEREAQAVASLSHPNIIQVHDFGEDKGFSYIVMELLTGGTLQELMGRKMPLTEVMGLIVPLASALDYAHRQGVVHRDIKPSNVLLDPEGRPLLSDFGLARLLEGSTALTGAGKVLGTPEYMAPEQALGRQADQRADLYALGIVIYQMLLGQTPFKSDTPSTTLMAHVHSPVPLPSAEDPDFDPMLEATLIKALAKDPDDRYQTSSDLAEALRQASPEQDIPAKQPVGDEAEDLETLVETTAGIPPVGDVRPPDRGDEDTRISLDQAGVLAIRHARENTEFYGRRYSGRELMWEVVDSEEGEAYFQVELSYRPARQFFGKPGTEKFTIDKSGAIELRQLEKEPSEGFRQLINESVEIAERRVPLVGLTLVVVVGIVVAGLLYSGPLSSRGQSQVSPTDLAVDPTGPGETTPIPTLPSKPPVATLPAPDPKSVGHITFAHGGKVYRVEAREGAEPEDISAALDSLSPASEDDFLSTSSDGKWLVVESERFDPECVGWSCLAVVAGDLTSGDVVRVNPGSWDVLHAWDGVAAISPKGDLLVYAADATEPKEADLYVVRRLEEGWGEPKRLTSESPYLINSAPRLSQDRVKVVFQCGDDAFYLHSICEVSIDGSGFREVLSPEARSSPDPGEVTLYSPSYAPDGSIIFAASWDGDRIWRLPRGEAEPVPLRGEHWSPCVLPDGRIVGVFYDWSKDGTLPDVHINVISPSGFNVSTVVVVPGVEDFQDFVGCSE